MRIGNWGLERENWKVGTGMRRLESEDFKVRFERWGLESEVWIVEIGKRRLESGNC